jgi:tetratricopeptide (TPR) repeat protein
MRDGRVRVLLVAWAALLSLLGAVVVNLATNLSLPEFTENPWVVWPALVVVWLLGIPVTLRLTAEQAHGLSLVGRVGLLAASARLPSDSTPLLGRDGELTMLRNHFLASGPAGPRIAVLSGPPGVGKSALAIHLAHRLAGEFDRRALYADLGGLGADRSDPAEVLSTFLHALRVPDEAIPSGLKERAALYQSRLADQRALVVLDNTADANQVAFLIPEGDRSWVLVTSRARLATLPRARSVALGALSEAPAVRLLGVLAGPERIRSDRQAAEEVARICGGLPLALRIAAARLASREAWTVATLAEYLIDRRRRLSRLVLENLEVRASFALSYDDLPEAAARGFRLLGLLAGPEVSVEVAAALIGDGRAAAQEDLETMVDAQLLQAVEPERYRMHDLLHLFAQELVAHEPVEQQRAALERALGWLAVRANEAGQVLTGMAPVAGREGQTEPEVSAFLDRGVALAWVAKERPNLVKAVHLAYEQRLYPLTWQIANGMQAFFQFRGFWSQWQETQILALQAARAAGDRTAEVKALGGLGDVAKALRQFDQAIDHYKQALMICREVGDHQGEAASLNGFARANYELRRLDEAIDYHQQALTIYQEIGNRRGEGGTLNDLGMVNYQLRQLDEAIDHYQQSLAIRQEIGDRRGEGGTLNNLGLVYEIRRQFHTAIDYYQQALAIHREVGDLQFEGNTLGNIGLVYVELRRFTESIACIEQELAIRRKVGDRGGEGSGLLNLGTAYHRSGQLDDAIDYYQQALTIHREVGDRRRQGDALHNLGAAYHKLRRLDEAIDHFQQSLAIRQEIGDRRGQANSLYSLGRVYYQSNRFDEAIDYHQQALTIYREVGDRSAEGGGLMTLGKAHEARGRLEKAMLCYEQALVIFEERADRHEQATALARLGDVARRQRHRGEAISFHSRSLAIFRELNDRHGQDWALMTLAELAKEQGRLKDAANYEEQRLALPQGPDGPPPS